jgi:hypothetical protein
MNDWNRDPLRDSPMSKVSIQAGLQPILHSKKGEPDVAPARVVGVQFQKIVLKKPPPRTGCRERSMAARKSP